MIQLSHRDQKIFFYRILGATYKSLGKEFGLCKQRVWQICRRGLTAQSRGIKLVHVDNAEFIYPRGYFSLHETSFGDYDPYLKENWRLKKLADDRRMSAMLALSEPNISDVLDDGINPNWDGCVKESYSSQKSIDDFFGYEFNQIVAVNHWQEPGAESPVTAPRVPTVPEDRETGDAALQQSSPATKPVNNGDRADNGQAVA